MPNSRDTFVAWNHCQSGIAVLPVGACEQHSYHLPLATDALLAEYFAEFIGKQLDAAVLPALTFGTSYEHTGFRGTFSLSPETAMAVIRDLATEAELQNFHTFIIVNFHGGNFFLAPVVRDINRHHPKIKVLLAFPPEFSPSPVCELHSGEWETSILLHLFPQFVLPIQPNKMHPDWTEQRFRQPDLNHWGLGRVSPNGALGYPEKASIEKGAKIVTEIKDGLIKWIQQYSEWQEKYPHYADCGGITYRKLSYADIPETMNLTVEANWNQTREDWRNYITFNPRGCLAAVRQGQTVGTATTIDYEHKFGWIGMVLVGNKYRHQGIGRQLLQKSLENLSECQCVKLDATP
ncbi:GNAT family N-acetyltransferase, partial [bacterium]|nr:GNAT family N-acetyltransferase [bacterium]